MAGWKEKAEDAKKSEQGGGDQDLLDVTCRLSGQMEGVCDIQVRLRTAFVKDFIPFPNSSDQIPFLIPHKTAYVHTL